MKSERLSTFTDGCELLQSLWGKVLTSLMNWGVKRCNEMLSVSTSGLPSAREIESSEGPLR